MKILVFIFSVSMVTYVHVSEAKMHPVQNKSCVSCKGTPKNIELAASRCACNKPKPDETTVAINNLANTIIKSLQLVDNTNLNGKIAQRAGPAIAQAVKKALEELNVDPELHKQILALIAQKISDAMKAGK